MAIVRNTASEMMFLLRATGQVRALLMMEASPQGRIISPVPMAQSRMGTCGGRQELIGRSGLRAGCAAPGTLIPGGATARRSPCYSWRCGYEMVRSAARATLAEAEAVVGRMEVKYGVGIGTIRFCVCSP